MTVACHSSTITTDELVEGISVWNRRRRVDAAFGALLAWLVDHDLVIMDHPGPFLIAALERNLPVTSSRSVGWHDRGNTNAANAGRCTLKASRSAHVSRFVLPARGVLRPSGH
jgi:hypothetical protein